MELAERIAKLSPPHLKAAKEAIQSGMSMSRSEALGLNKMIAGFLWPSPSVAGETSAFFERQKPKF